MADRISAGIAQVKLTAGLAETKGTSHGEIPGKARLRSESWEGGQVTEATRPVLSGWRILVVEDEYFLADDIKQALGKLGAEVVGPVPTLDRALAALEGDGQIAAAVLDINLRDQSSFPVADALLARGTPFVFATGYDPAVMPPGYDHVPHWVKPFDPGALVRALPALLQSTPARGG